MKKTIKYIFYSLLALLLGVLTAILLIFNNAAFQRWVTSEITSYLSAQFKTKITIDHIKYHPFGGFSLDNVYWGDQKNDTLFFVDDLRFNFGGFNKKNLTLTLNDVVLEGGYCKLITYPDSTFNIDVLFNIEDPNDTIPDTISPPFSLFFNRIACHNTRFRLIDSTEAFEPAGFDGFNEDFREIEILAKNLWIVEDSLHFEMKNFATTERCGFRVDHISGIGTICSTAMLFDSMQVRTPYSSVSRKFHMRYPGWSEIADFYDQVQMDADVKNSRVDIRDIAYFAPFLAGSRQVFQVNGTGSGTVSNLKIADLNIDFGNSSKFTGSATIKGLPNVDETFLDVKARQAQTNKLDLERLIATDLPAEMQQLGNMKFKGRYTGFFNDFVAYGDFSAAIGNGKSDLNMKLGDSVTVPSYSGNLTLTDFDIGAMFKQPGIGKTSLTATVNGKGFTLNELESSIETRVSYFEANHYQYKQIELGGAVKHKMFKGMFEMKDPNAAVRFNGTIDLNQQIPLYQFKASIDYADLRALKFDTSHLVLSSDIDINFAIKDLDHNSGTIRLNRVLFIKDGVDYPIENIVLSSEISNNQKKLTLQSDMLDAGLSGDFSFEYLPATLKQFVHTLLPDYIASKPSRNTIPQVFDYYLNLSNSKVLSDLFFPELQIINGKVKGTLNEKENELTLNASIDQLEYEQSLFHNITTNATIEGNGTGNINIGIMSLQNKDTSIFKDLNIQSKLANNKIRTEVTIRDTTGLISGDINMLTGFAVNNISTSISNSWFGYKHKSFELSEQSQIAYDEVSHKLSIQNFSITHAAEKIDVNGFYATGTNYNLLLQLTDLDLSIIGLIFPSVNITTGGKADGKIVLSSNEESLLVNSFLTVNNFALDKDTIGDFSITSNYDEKQQRIIAQVKSVSGKLKDLTLAGYIDVSRKPYPVNANITFSESDLKSFQAFIKDEVTIYYGKATAKCKITGTVDDIQLDGNVSINQVLARVEYLKTIYGFNAKVTFDKKNITLTPFQLKDINGRQALVGGTISHHSFHNFYLDLTMNELNGFQVLNTTSKDNDLFYGTAYATGRMSLKGPMDNLLLDAVLKTYKGTVLSIPLSSSEDDDGDKLLNFVDKDTSLKSVNIKKQSVLLGLSISMNVAVTPDAEIQLVFDEIQEDKIVGTGRGILQMDLSKQGAFNMYGQIAIEDGEYKFTAVDVFTRKFELKKGGTITWSGDPFQARMNIQGIYRVKSTSLANLLPTLTETQIKEMNQNRVPVDCILNLKGNLLAPDISFDLNLPGNSTLAGNNASIVESSLRRLRNEPDLMQQQVVSLMLFGQFAPVGQQTSEQTNLGSGLSNTLSDLISAQATNILSNILPGVALNVEYQNAIGKQQAFFSASKKFLNERFEVQTRVDVINSTSNNSIIGQYDLRQDGNLKLRGFNRTAPNPIYNQNITTRGVGLYYRKEFDTFNELLKRKNKKLITPIPNK